MNADLERVLDAWESAVRKTVHANITANSCNTRSDHRRADEAAAVEYDARAAVEKALDALERRAEKAEARRGFLDEAAVIDAVRASNGRVRP